MDGTQPEWMIMTGYAPGSVDIDGAVLNPTNNLITGVHIKHKGDSVVKEIPIAEFMRDNFANVSRWLHRHGTPEELHQDQLCYKVARCKWRSWEFKERATQDIHGNSNNL